MNKKKVATTVALVIETMIPQEVSQWIKTKCPVVVNDLSDWDIAFMRKHTKGEDLFGVFGFENDKPIIGLNHRALKTTQEVIKTILHEIAHMWLWHIGLPNGERAASKLAKQWQNN